MLAIVLLAHQTPAAEQSSTQKIKARQADGGTVAILSLNLMGASRYTFHRTARQFEAFNAHEIEQQRLARGNNLRGINISSTNRSL